MLTSSIFILIVQSISRDMANIYTQYIYLATSITSDNVIFKTVYIVIDILQGPNNFNHNFILNLNLQGSGLYSERYSRPKDSRRA